MGCGPHLGQLLGPHRAALGTDSCSQGSVYPPLPGAKAGTRTAPGLGESLLRVRGRQPLHLLRACPPVLPKGSMDKGPRALALLPEVGCRPQGGQA